MPASRMAPGFEAMWIELYRSMAFVDRTCNHHTKSQEFRDIGAFIGFPKGRNQIQLDITKGDGPCSIAYAGFGSAVEFDDAAVRRELTYLGLLIEDLVCYSTCYCSLRWKVVEATTEPKNLCSFAGPTNSPKRVG